MKNEEGDILYVGKAKELRKRVSSYLRKQNNEKVTMLMSLVFHIDYIVTENEYEALLLEHNLIKEYHPKYNILLRDDKTFPMIKITKEEYPRVVKTRKIISDGGEYFGPYIDGFLMNKYLELIEKNFSLRRCTKIKTRSNPCMYYHIGRCAAVCANLISKTEYMARVKKIRSLLKGHTKILCKDIIVQMHTYAKTMEFEKAAQCRDSLAALESIGIPHNTKDIQSGFRNYIGIASHDNECCIVIAHMKEGKAIDQHTVYLNTFDSLEDSLGQFLLMYYRELNKYPDIIFSPLTPSEEITHYFLQHNTIIQTPTHTRNSAIIRFANKEARLGLAQHIRKVGKKEAVYILQATLGLINPPLYIEGFDIATMHGTHTTAALVCFYNGIPDKTKYRYFKIKSLASGEMDDFQSIQEAVSRRYSRLKNEKKPMPDLILIDGGLGQVNSAKQVLDALELDIPIIGLAKKREEIYFPSEFIKSVVPTKGYRNNATKILSNPLQISIDSPASRLLQAIRNEAHRFATTFRQKKQIKTLTRSQYTAIKGIGNKKAQKIMEKFPNPRTITETSLDILVKNLGITIKMAEELFRLAKNMDNND